MTPSTFSPEFVLPRQTVIPFFVAPYPDEMLGSWLFRLQTHNSRSLVQQLAGYQTRARVDASGWRDIAQPSPDFVRLLTALGKTYSTAMLERTTYPYWLRFHSAHQFEMAQQSEPVELPVLVLRETRRAIPRLRYLLPNFSRICPVCLADDFVQQGEPYLHRAHHLPFVRCCHKHGNPLISRCPKCKQLFRMASTFVYARLTCTCGYDLRRIPSDNASHEDPWKRLARYSADVLFSSDPIEDCNTSHAFMNDRLAEWELTQRPDVLKHLSNIYGVSAARAILTLAPQRSDTFTFAPIGSVSKHEFRAPQICALFATVDADFAQSQRRFGDFTRSKEKVAEQSAPEVRVDTAKQRIPQSVAQARLHVHEVEASIGARKTRSYLYQRRKTLFWYLTLFDKVWFEERYPHGRRGATAQLPSVDADRLCIEQAIIRADSNRVREWKALAQQAFFRASLRDTTWLDDRKAETTRAIRTHRAETKKQYLKACENDIQEAASQIQTDRGRSLRATLSEISLYTALNKDQWRHLLANNPDLRNQLGLAEATTDSHSKSAITVHPC